MVMYSIAAQTPEDVKAAVIDWCEHKAARLHSKYGSKRDREICATREQVYLDVAEFWRQVAITPKA